MIYLISVVLTNRNLKGLFEFFEMKNGKLMFFLRKCHLQTTDKK